MTVRKRLHVVASFGPIHPRSTLNYFNSLSVGYLNSLSLGLIQLGFPARVPAHLAVILLTRGRLVLATATTVRTGYDGHLGKNWT